MFSGIVEETGRVVRIGDDSLEISARLVLDGTKLGDSIAVNGACLTVVDLAGAGSEGSFTVGVIPETWRRTNLGELRSGDLVNLERAIAVGGRLGGHYVQGHVDGRGRILQLQPEANAINVTIEAPADLMPYIVVKGFIAVDGISLTIVETGQDCFVVSLIPFTRQHTNFAMKRLGDTVNLEVDILAKYVESLLQARLIVGDGESKARR